MSKQSVMSIFTRWGCERAIAPVQAKSVLSILNVRCPDKISKEGTVIKLEYVPEQINIFVDHFDVIIFDRACDTSKPYSNEKISAFSAALSELLVRAEARQQTRTIREILQQIDYYESAWFCNIWDCNISVKEQTIHLVVTPRAVDIELLTKKKECTAATRNVQLTDIQSILQQLDFFIRSVDKVAKLQGEEHAGTVTTSFFSNSTSTDDTSHREDVKTAVKDVRPANSGYISLDEVCSILDEVASYECNDDSYGYASGWKEAISLAINKIRNHR